MEFYYINGIPLNSITVTEFHYFSLRGMDISHVPCYVVFMQELESKFQTNMVVNQCVYHVVSFAIDLLTFLLYVCMYVHIYLSKYLSIYKMRLWCFTSVTNVLHLEAIFVLSYVRSHRITCFTAIFFIHNNIIWNVSTAVFKMYPNIMKNPVKW